jgi:hypothetical protein
METTGGGQVEGRCSNRWRAALVVASAWGVALLLVGTASAFQPPEGLPDVTEMPDLYDPEIVETYTLVAKRPYRVDGRELAPWLVATVLTPKAAHVGPPAGGGGGVRGGGVTPRDVILVIGYVTDTRDGRIIALSETFAHPSDGTRSIKAWVDEGWVKEGKGSGEWGTPIRSQTALQPREVPSFMEKIYALIEAGFEKSLGR